MAENNDVIDFYQRVLGRLLDAEVPFLVGGGYGLTQHTGMERRSRDLDLFLCAGEVGRAMEVLDDRDWDTQLTHPHWLAKVKHRTGCADLIFSSGNGLAPVEDEWFDYATSFELLGVEVRLCPAEEMIWQKAFVMERERFDGADVLHLVLARGSSLDWSRLLRRFLAHEEVLLAHLLLFRYVYPGFAEQIPAGAMAQLSARLSGQKATAPLAGESPLCRGTYLSRSQYLTDIRNWGFRDVRLQPLGPLTAEQVASWTDAIDVGAVSPTDPVQGRLFESNLHDRGQ